MDIHAPESPISNFKDFALHIGIVTCGILIALGLEGLREALHSRHLVRETRENIRKEMEIDLTHQNLELPRVTLYRDQLKSLIEDLPAIGAQHPEQISQRLAQIENPGYFFISSSWQTALSTGALEHMPTDEVTAYGSAAEVIHIYAGLQKDAQTEEGRTKAFFTAHPHPTPEQMEEGTERVLLFYRAEEGLAFVGPQLKSQFEHALAATAAR